eukprot:2365409-Rhodomonas_salina.1
MPGVMQMPDPSGGFQNMQMVHIALSPAVYSATESYAVSSTDVAYSATESHAVSGTDVAYSAVDSGTS